jgi:putative ABC transport system permease protein
MSSMKKSFRLTDVRPDASRDVDDEVAFHLEMRTREYMDQGHPEEEARRLAAESFGDVQAIRGSLQDERRARNQERSRNEWWTDFLLDLRYAARTLIGHRAFAIAAIATLALGIGANSAIFSIVNSVLLRPLAYPNADRLAVVHGMYPEYGRTSFSLPDYVDWRNGSGNAFETLAARHSAAFNYMADGEPVQLRADRVTANFFSTLGVSPMLGRGFAPEEEVGGDDFVVVLSHGFWQRQFAGRPDVIGSTMLLSGQPYQVIGVAPPTFRFWRDVDLWAPTRIDIPDANRRSEYLSVFGRMRPGVTVDQAAAEMQTIAARVARDYPNTNANFQTETVGLQDDIVASAKPALLVFMGAVGLVLLIACANVANLLLARAAAREREMAVRSALGASRGRLIRQLLTESTLVALIGGVTGLLLATWAIGAIRATGTTLLPRLAEIRIDMLVALFAIGLSLATGLLFGLAPAIRLASGRLHSAIKEGARGAAGGGAARFRNALVLAEVALAVVLLVGAGLLIRSFERLNQVDPGFQPDGVITYQVVFPSSRYQAQDLVPIFDRIIQATGSVPGVTAVSLSGDMPMNGAGYVTFAVEGRPAPAPNAGTGPEDVQPFNVSPDYLEVMGLRLREGRFIETRDVDGAGDVAVINTEFARRFIPEGRPALGSRVTFGNPTAPDAEWWTVVGIVDVVAQEGLAAKPYPQIYLPIAQARRRGVYVSARTDGDPMALVPQLRQALKTVDAELPMNDVRTLRQRVADNIAAPRVSVIVLAAFAGLALTLAAIGIYGVLAYSVAQRTREIGIRMALGANAGDVRNLIVRQGMTPAVIGLGVGLVGAFWLTILMEKLLFGVAPRDPLTFASVSVFLFAIALIACYVPARRATIVAPTECLRYD